MKKEITVWDLISICIGVAGLVVAGVTLETTLSRNMVLYNSTINVPFSNQHLNASIANFRQVTVNAALRPTKGIAKNLLTVNGTVWIDNQASQISGWDVYGGNSSGTYYFGVSKVVAITGQELILIWSVNCSCNQTMPLQVWLYLTH